MPTDTGDAEASVPGATNATIRLTKSHEDYRSNASSFYVRAWADSKYQRELIVPSTVTHDIGGVAYVTVLRD